MHTPTQLLALIIPLALAACAVNTDVPSRVAVPPSFEQTSEQAGAIGQPETALSQRKNIRPIFMALFDAPQISLAPKGGFWFNAHFR